MKVYAITGGIGSGKSFVSEKFSKFGIAIFNADIEAKKCYTDIEIKNTIIKYFGNEIYDNNILNRKKLADIVFNDKSKLELLNSIIHPEVSKRYDDWIKIQKSSPYLIYENAILFEQNLQNRFDGVIMVYCPKEIRIERAIKRDLVKKEDIENRIKNQMPDELKKYKSDYIIYNNGIEDVDLQVFKLYNKFMNK